MSRKSSRLASGAGGSAPCSAPTPIQVKKTSLLSATCEPYPRQVDGVGRKAAWKTGSQHKCCRDRHGQAYNIEIVKDKGSAGRRLQCLGDAVAECPMFAGDWWTFERVNGGEVTVKLCWCCACHYLQGNPNLNNRRDRISPDDILRGLKTTWEIHELSSGAKVEVVGSTRMIDEKVESNDFNIIYAEFKDKHGNPADADAIVDEVDTLREEQVLRSNFGTDGGKSSGFGKWEELRQTILDKCPILARWLAEYEELLGKQSSSSGKAGTVTSLHFAVTGRSCSSSTDTPPNGLGFRVPHGTEVVMSRRMGGPDDRGMMHIVPAGGKSKFIAIEYGNLKAIEAEANGDTVFEHAMEDDEVIDEDQFLKVSGYKDEETLQEEAERVTHNLDDDGAETGKMPAS
ncbi:hypothetical protein THAOC_33959, partial [Thalassiosira oceanica]